MKISEQQLMMLLDTLKDSLRIEDDGAIFTYSTEGRTELINEIYKQQDKEPIEVSSIDLPDGAIQKITQGIEGN